MPQFPSLAWMRAYADALRDHPDSAALARSLEGDYRFVVTPAGPLADAQSFDVRIAAGEDHAPRFTAGPAGAGTPRLTLTADYLRWRDLITGRLDIMVAVLLRRVRVDGDLAGVRSSLSDARPLLDALRSVETTWP